MRRKWNQLVISLIFPAVCAVFPSVLNAQSSQTPPSRIAAIDESSLILLKGNHPPQANLANDRGPVDSHLPMERMLLVLKRDPITESSLRQLIADQQDRSSPSFHAWLSPAEFGARFGPSASDLQKLTAWLASHGFVVNGADHGGMVIEFSGTARQVEAAFRTQIHRYVVNGANHYANASDPQIPAALSQIVAGINTLNNFPKQSPVRFLGSATRIANTSEWQPDFTFNSGGQTFHFMAPGDFSKIYDLDSLLRAGIDGTGQSIAIVGRSNINLSDLQIFRLAFGLPLTLPQIILNGPDPGNTFGTDETEADLDIEWSGAIAPNATIKFVVSASTNTTDGVDLSSEYIVDNNLAPVLSASFGQCESIMGQAESLFFNNLWEQAAAQGITVVVASGDAGPAGCDNPQQGGPATGGAAVSGLASTPFNIAAGGTQFNENGNFSAFWAPNNGPDQSSALGYIPENVWHESCSAPAQCTFTTLFASGGGPSALYSKPTWQAGLGVPADGMRDLPDVSLAAASGHDGYLVCQDGICLTNSNNQLVNAAVVGGTSAAAPTFAAIMALVNQKTNSRQGQANFVLYPLASTQNPANCNASAAPQSTCIFNDVTAGDSTVPGQTGYPATPGYDLATGLGSINAANLVNQWTNITFRATSASLLLSPTTVTHGQPMTASVTVTPAAGAGTPTGEVSLLAADLRGVNLGVLTAGAVSGMVTALPGGSYSVSAAFSGDGAFGSAISNSVPVHVNPEGSSTSFVVLTAANLTPITSTTFSSTIFLQAQSAGTSGQGVATGTVTFSDTLNGTTSPLTTVTLNSRGLAQVPNSSLALGTHLLTASYSGDPSFSPSAGAPVTLTVTKGTTQTFLFVPSGALPNSPVLLQALVIPNGSFFPTGTVQFFSGSTAIGNPTQVTSELASLNIVLPTGQDSITATYSGDSNFTGSTSSPAVIGIGNPDFRIAVNPGNLTVAVNAPATATLLLSPGTGLGFSGPVTFSCSGLPASGAACSFQPQQLNLDGFTTMAATVSISETVTGGVNHVAARQLNAPILHGLGGLTMTALLLIVVWPIRNRSRKPIILLILTALLCSLAGCNNSSPTTNPNIPGPTAGTTAIITVTASGKSGTTVVSHAVTMSVTFN